MSTHEPDQTSRMDALHYYFGLLDGVDASCVFLVLTEQPVQEEVAEAYLEATASESRRLRQHFRSIPGNLARPLWIDDSAFDVSRHVRPIHLGGGGTARDMFEYGSRWRNSGFTEDQSPWEVGLVDGLSDGTGAVLVRFHHSLADGAALHHEFTPIFDRSLGAAASPAGFPRDRRGIARRAVAERRSAAMQTARALWALPADLRKQGVRAQVLGSLAGIAAAPPAGRVDRSLVPGSSAMFTIPTSLWSARAREAGGGSNDLFLALAAAAVRTSGVLGDKPTYLTAMPISLRQAGAPVDGNETGVAFLALDGESSLLDDLRAVRAHAQAGKAAASGDANPIVERALDLLPGRLQAKLILRQWAKKDILATNVVIPEFETVFGVAINAITGMPALIGGPLGFVLVTRGDQRVMHVDVDRSLVPDDQSLFSCLDELLVDRFGRDNVGAIMGRPPERTVSCTP